MKSLLDLDAFQQHNGLQFTDIRLLRTALTHPSFANEHPGQGVEDNQRLEFLGDAVLTLISSDWLYEHLPGAPEGQLTRLRSALVRSDTLAALAEQCQIGEALRMGHGEESTGGRQRPTALCDAFEALVGALYLDQGIEAARAFSLPLLEQALAVIHQAGADRDPKSLLQEWVQRHLGLTPEYVTVDTQGPDHARLFTVEVLLGGQPYARGTGSRKQLAAQDAARRALAMLQAEHGGG